MAPQITFTTGSGQPESVVRAQAIDAVRDRFLAHYEENKDFYDAEDVNRLRNSGLFPERFLLWKKGDEDGAFEMLKACFRWRQEMAINQMTPDMFPHEFYASGGLFVYEPDLEGTPLLYMRVKMIRRIPELDEPLKAFIAHNINRVDTEAGKLLGWGIVFDCSEIGLSNVHLELVKFLINTLKDYFPFGLKYTVVYELPWILSAVQKVVFAMLPEEAKQIVQFKTRKTIREFIGKESLPDYMGGECTTSYHRVPQGCRSIVDMADNYAFNGEQAKKIKKHFEQFYPSPKGKEDAKA